MLVKGIYFYLDSQNQWIIYGMDANKILKIRFTRFTYNFH
jgi:hypothetical protein